MKSTRDLGLIAGLVVLLIPSAGFATNPATAITGKAVGNAPMGHQSGITSKQPALLVAPVSLFKQDFDTSGYGESEVEAENGGICRVRNRVPDSGNMSTWVGKAVVWEGQDSVRAELTLGRTNRVQTWNRRYIYRWSYFIPDDFFDRGDIQWIKFGQWKTHPCVNDPDGSGGGFDYDGAICYSEGIFDDIDYDNNSFDFRLRAKEDCDHAYVPIVTGRWVKFEADVKWSAENDGHVRLYMDGNPVPFYERTNMKTIFTPQSKAHSEACKVYWSVGIYTEWTSYSGLPDDELFIYIDDIEILEYPVKVPVQAD